MAGTGGLAAAAAAKASGSARSGLQWALAGAGTCVVFYVASAGRLVADPTLAMGLSMILLGVAVVFPIAGYIGGEVKPALMFAAIATALAAGVLAALVGVAPVLGHPEYSTPVLRAALPVLIIPALGISAASPPGSKEGWRLAYAVGALVVLAEILAVQNHATHQVKHLVGDTFVSLVASPVGVVALRGMLNAMGLAKPVTKKEFVAAEPPKKSTLSREAKRAARAAAKAGSEGGGAAGGAADR
jgi:hypothetical protein